MAKYKVCYSGFAYVDADSRDEAEDAYIYGINDFEEKSIDLMIEVGESWKV